MPSSIVLTIFTFLKICFIDEIKASTDPFQPHKSKRLQYQYNNTWPRRNKKKKKKNKAHVQKDSFQRNAMLEE